ncbi:MAG: gliding motility-associated C-terminal domain-containing protein [Bacteroidia bacterium]
MIRLLFLIFLTAFTLNLKAQVPHEWYLGNGKVMKFTMHGGMEIVDDTTVMEDFSRGQHFQILDEKNNISEILYEDLVWKKTPDGFTKTKLSDEKSIYRCWTVIDEFRFYEKIDDSSQVLVLKFSDSKQRLILDSIPFREASAIQNTSYFKISENQIVFSVTYFDRIGFLKSRLYHLKNDVLESKVEKTLFEKKNTERALEPWSYNQYKIDSNKDIVSIIYRNDTLGSDRNEIYTYIVNCNLQGDLDFGKYKAYKGLKNNFVDGGFYQWGNPVVDNVILSNSTTDSFYLLTSRKSELGVFTNSFGKNYYSHSWTNESRFKKSSSNLKLIIDSSDYLPVYRKNYLFNNNQKACNGKSYQSFFTKTDSNCLVVTNANSNNAKLREQIDILPAPDLNNYPFELPLPHFNKSYKRLEFRSAKECTQQLRLFAFADNYYDSFEWHIANDTGGYDIRYGNNLVYDAPGKNKFYVILKGIHTRTGYFAWNSDSVSFNTSPKADFVADTNKWCQYVELKLQDSSILVEGAEHEYEWKVYKDGEIERTLYAQNPTIKFQQTGDYDIQLTVSNATCSDSIKKSAVIDIIEAPKPGFNLSDTLICAPDTLHIKSTAQGRISSLKYFANTLTDSIYTPDFSFEIIDTSKIFIKQVLRGPTGCITNTDTQLVVQQGFEPDAIAPLTSVSVIDSSVILINWDSFPNSISYSLNRDDTLIYQGSNSYFLDSQKNTTYQSYRYNLTATDACKRVSISSPLMNNMVLRVQNQNNEAAILKWSSYIGWPKGISNYVIEEELAPNDWFEIDNTLDTVYSDYLNIDDNNRTVNYRIKAIENGNANVYSLSNVVNTKFKTLIFIPNAFSPNGDGIINDTFQLKGVGVKEISFRVYSRTGQSLHYSTDPSFLWDGLVNGGPIEGGAYYYLLKLTTVFGETLEFNDVVFIIK